MRAVPTRANRNRPSLAGLKGVLYLRFVLFRAADFKRTSQFLRDSKEYGDADSDSGTV
jgi:hypothetical protein